MRKLYIGSSILAASVSLIAAMQTASAADK